MIITQTDHIKIWLQHHIGSQSYIGSQHHLGLRHHTGGHGSERTASTRNYHQGDTTWSWLQSRIRLELSVWVFHVTKPKLGTRKASREHEGAVVKLTLCTHRVLLVFL